jgi:hypothetical protein
MLGHRRKDVDRQPVGRRKIHCLKFDPGFKEV